VTPEILIDAVELPGTPPNDPADRFLIATARQHGLRLVTRDALILAYGQGGHVLTLEC
jgi:PIN domain nuclease of toxin-antitoxin system